MSRTGEVLLIVEAGRGLEITSKNVSVGSG